nr:O-antigen ligase family protein [Lysinibacillus timonensis]
MLSTETKDFVSVFLLYAMLLLSLLSYEMNIYANFYDSMLIAILAVGMFFIMMQYFFDKAFIAYHIAQALAYNKTVLLLIYLLVFSSLLTSVFNGFISFSGFVKLLSIIVSILLFFFIVPTYLNYFISRLHYLIIFFVTIASVIGMITKFNGRFLIYETYYGRVDSIYFDPNYFGTLAGIAVLLALRYPGFLFKLAMLINLVAVLFSNSRTVFLALVFTLIVTYFYQKRIEIRHLFVGVILFVAIAIGTHYLYELDFFRTHQGLNDREELWKAAVALIGEQPFWGYGQEVIPDLLAQKGVHFNSTHNAYLDYMLSYGIVCGLVYIAIILISLYRGVKHKVHVSFIQVVLFLFICSFMISINIGGLGSTSFLFTLYLGLCNSSSYAFWTNTDRD